MYITISFSAKGYVSQEIFLNANGMALGVKKIQQLLNEKSLFTTVEKNGTLEIVENGIVLGEVGSVDNNLEYEDFVVE